ncbi:MAG: hypothetical protein JWO77_1655 [Ilumatobacteraceae bacterium]|nr:hypothetical protein [Ilumatobacteraceae bacterium]
MLALLIVLTYVVITPLEVRLGGPATRSRRANLAMILPVLVAAALSDLALVGVSQYGHRHGAGLLPWLGLSGLPALVATIVVVDLAGYLTHRWSHTSARLWSVHRAHHTDPDMDVTTSLRNHPLDVVAIVLGSSLAVLLLGAAPAHVAVSGALGAVFGLWDHIRIVLPRRLERALVWVIQTPGLHRVHHSPTLPETNTNYGLIFTFWDRLLGTYSPPDGRHPTGLDTLDLAERQTVRAMLLEPARPLVKAPTGAPDLAAAHARS